MIVYVLFVHKKSVSKRKVCIIFIKNSKLKKNKKKTFLVGFLCGFFCGGFFMWGLFGWVFLFGFFGWVFYWQPCQGGAGWAGPACLVGEPFL